MYKGICTYQACQSGHCASDNTYGSLDTWTIICLTATKLEPFVFPMLGFLFAYVSDIYIVLNLYNFCLLPTYFCYVIVNVWNLERPM
jgi:hypothetical protein